MILADTSVWIDHFRARPRAAPMTALLVANQIRLHSSVLGELTLGGLGEKGEVILHLRRVPSIASLTDDDVLNLVRTRRLSGRGIGWVDAHLLAAALAAGVRIWTFDGGLAKVAHDLGVLHQG